MIFYFPIKTSMSDIKFPNYYVEEQYSVYQKVLSFNSILGRLAIFDEYEEIH